MDRLHRLTSQLTPHPVDSSSSSSSGSHSNNKYGTPKPSELIQKYLQQPIYNDLGKLTNHQSLKGKTVFITGASRGIGLAIGLKAARDGANVVVAAKTIKSDPRLPGTIYTAADEINKAGGKALAIQLDIRDEQNIISAVKQAVDKFGGIDILVNNASAISLTDTIDTTSKKYDLMQQINVRGTWLCTKHCLPYLRKSAEQGKNPHVLNLGPPLNFEERWFAPHVAYTIAKYSMSLLVLGGAGENREYGVAFNSLWPISIIATAAVQNLLGGDESVKRSRTAEIMSDAAYVILTSDARKVTGQYFIDEAVMRASGLKDKDLKKYQYDKNVEIDELGLDFFI